MAKIIALQDHGVGPGINTALWDDTLTGGSSITPSAAGYVLAASAGEATLDALTTWDMEESRWVVRLRSLSLASGAIFRSRIDAGAVKIEVTIEAGQLTAVVEETGQPNATIANLAYNATNHEFMQARLESSTMYFDVSSAGVSWNNLGNEVIANSMAVSAAAIFVEDPATASQGTIQLGPPVTLTGTAASGTTEAHIVAGGRTIILTLTGTTWIPA